MNFMRIALITMIAGMISLSLTSAADNIDCSRVDAFKHEMQDLNNGLVAAQNAFEQVKLKIKAAPTKEELSKAKGECEKIKNDINGLKEAISKAELIQAKSVLTSEADQQVLEDEIKHLDDDIDDSDKKIKNLSSLADANKKKFQKIIDEMKQSTIDPQIEKITKVMPTAILKDYDSRSLAKWIDQQTRRTNEPVLVTRDGHKSKERLEDLDANEMVQYSLVTNADISTAKEAILAIKARETELLKKEKEGEGAQEERVELERIPSRYIHARNKMVKIFEKQFSLILVGFNDLKKEVHSLSKIEDDFRSQMTIDTNAIETEKANKTSLNKEKASKEMLLVKLKNALSARADAIRYASQIKDKEEALFQQEEIIRVMRDKRAQWKNANQAWLAAKNAYENKKAEQVQFEEQRKDSEKQVMAEIYQKTTVLNDQYKKRTASIQDQLKTMKESLVKKHDELLKNANELLSKDKYLAGSQKRIQKDWDVYQQKMIKKAQPQLKSLVSTSESVAKEIREVLAGLDPYNCPEFPKLQTYRTKMISFADKLVVDAQGAATDITKATIDLPAVPPRTIEGHWNSNFGCTTFSKSTEKQFKGRIHYTDGSKGDTTGEFDGDLYAFQWSSDKKLGNGQLKLSEDGTKLDGRYRDDKGRTRTWTLTKRKAECE